MLDKVNTDKELQQICSTKIGTAKYYVKATANKFLKCSNSIYCNQHMGMGIRKAKLRAHIQSVL